MAQRKHTNAEDRMVPFLSNLVGGDVTQDTPNRVNTATSEWADHIGGNSGQVTEVRGQSPARSKGNRSGTGKTVTVV